MAIPIAALSTGQGRVPQDHQALVHSSTLTLGHKSDPDSNTKRRLQSADSLFSEALIAASLSELRHISLAVKHK